MQHVKIHTGEDSYRCDLCNKAFTRKYHLTQHLITHTGKMPYKCKFCEKAFAQEKDLK